GAYSVQVIIIGYSRSEQSITVTAEQVQTVDFSLTPAAIQLSEIVVTGTAGRTEKREVGNAVTSLEVGDLVDVAPVGNVRELLNARAPGLTLYKNSGLAGTGSNIKIRGGGTLNASYQPVYYIDGIRFEGNAFTTNGVTNSTVQYRSPMEFIDPNDIERIEVIKGPAAATLYGADAASGVIQIITKKGARGAGGVQWSASFEYGQSEWVRETPTTYWICTLARQDDPDDHPGCANPSDVQYTNNAGEQRFSIPESDILRNDAWGGVFVLTDNPLQRHPRALRAANLYDVKTSARGGTQEFNYYLSFNRLDQQGIFFNNFQERIGGRANFEWTPMGNLNLGLNVGYARNHTGMPLSDNASNGLLRNAYRGRARGIDDAWEPGFRGFGPDQTNEFDLQIREERTTIGLTASYDPFPWFENRLTLGVDKYDVRETEFFAIDSTLKWGATNGTGAISQRLPITHTWTVDYSGSIRARLSSVITSRFSGGMQVNARQYRRWTAEGNGLVANNVNLVGTAANRDASEALNEQTSLGFFFQEQIGWRDRVFVTGAVRIDDNSAFGNDFSLVVYPKFSASYVISEEDFFNVGFIDDLKLRFAWGQAGNAPAPFTADRTVQPDVVTAEATSVNAVRTDAFGNPDLKAETGSEWELGFDASLLGGVLGLEVTYYDQRTKDALMEIPDAPSTGFNSTHLINIGEISNTGFELLATASPIRNPSFSWDITASISTNKNRLVSFGGTRDEIQYGAFTNSQRHREGYPLGAFWAVDVIRDASG
ncbi:MAG: TonB-dependent receptor, partial [Rhodothermales bacterium]|nr:TonB-dependent receptor [Rhodothermales bacterium]